MTNNMKILFHPIESWGHINASIGMAQIMYKYGHEIVFVITRNLNGQFVKYGFEEIILCSNPNEDAGKINTSESNPTTNQSIEIESEQQKDCIDYLINNTDLFWERDPFKKYSMFTNIFKLRKQEIFENEKQMAEILRNIQPDLILIDQILISPSIMNSGIPWILIFSCNPLSLLDDDRNLPPPFSGLPIDDRSLWAKYRDEFNRTYQNDVIENQNHLLRYYGFNELHYNSITPPSPYLNIYGYPEELDYDSSKCPSNTFRIDTFCRHNEYDTLNFIDSDFYRKLTKNDKLIYISLGTLASKRFDMINRIITILSKTKHYYVVSKGQFENKGFELPANIFGEKHLPQTKILPLVNLVITHGGNNTVTESLLFGKPMIIMPFFADQYDNAQRLHEKGYGERLDPFTYKDEDLIDLIEKILNDVQMSERLSAISKRMNESNLNDKLVEKLEQIHRSSSRVTTNQ